jgi:GTPase
VNKQIEAAIAEADLILFVVDIREELMPLDEEVAQRLRYINTPVILVMNKADTEQFDTRGGEFYKLGRGKPIAVSVEQNRNQKPLLKLIEKMLPEDSEDKPADAVMKIAVVGRPNTGKSTFINMLAKAERMIVSEIPGTTRDSVDVMFELDGLPFMAIDTAGVRRKAKIRDSLDFYSIHRAERSIRRADVVFLLLDHTQGISRLEKQLADYIGKQYKPCIFVVNKVDLMGTEQDSEGRTNTMSRYAHAIQHAFRTMTYVPMAFITAQTGKNVKALLNLSQAMFKQAQKRVGTGTLNRVLREAVDAHPPSMRDNKTPRIYYATQVGTGPPTVVLFVNHPSIFDATYQRYLLNTFREKLPFHDIPIKLYLRARSQTDPDAPRSREDPTADYGSMADDDSAEHHAHSAGPDNREINQLLAGLED